MYHVNFYWAGWNAAQQNGYPSNPYLWACRGTSSYGVEGFPLIDLYNLPPGMHKFELPDDLFLVPHNSSSGDISNLYPQPIFWPTSGKQYFVTYVPDNLASFPGWRVDPSTGSRVGGWQEFFGNVDQPSSQQPDFSSGSGGSSFTVDSAWLVVLPLAFLLAMHRISALLTK